jgi:hypothetical protein
LENDMISKQPSEADIQKVCEAIARTVVVSPEPVHIRKQLFQLTREVKTIVGFEKPIDDTFKPIVKAWHKQSGKHLEDESIDILWAQFKTSWDKIKYPTGDAIFLTLIRKAECSEYPPISKNYQDVAKELIRLCAVLDAHWSPEPFYLSCRHAELLFGYSHAKMAKLLELLVLDGVLELVKKGSMGRASRYKYLADKGTIDLSSMESSGQLNEEVL